MIVSGTSGSGKTVFTMGLLSGDSEVGVSPSIDHVYWFYVEWQEKVRLCAQAFYVHPRAPRKPRGTYRRGSIGNQSRHL